MKKLFALISILGIFVFGFNSQIHAQKSDSTITTQIDTIYNNNTDSLAVDSQVNEEGKMHRQIKEKFIEGGPFFMSFILIAFILGLALAIERIIYLNFATTNSEKLLERIEKALGTGGSTAAKEICRNTRGPVASIFYQGLDRSHQGIEVVEKSVVSYGSVQTGLLEKGLTWISLFISLAPMLGFLGTVIGMIEAFDNIQAAGDINAGLVAGGIKVALITTVSGLIVAMVLQVFYNYIVSKIDSIVNDMENASISLIDIMVKYQSK
jgi:biopolymer transport protein ExbB